MIITLAPERPALSQRLEANATILNRYRQQHHVAPETQAVESMTPLSTTAAGSLQALRAASRRGPAGARDLAQR